MDNWTASEPRSASSEPDPELEALPRPRRPMRRVTLVVMTLAAIGSAVMAWSLRSEAAYALQSDRPLDVGTLESLEVQEQLANRWVRAEAALRVDGAVAFKRPLDPDTYRVTQVAGRERVWVETQVPESVAQDQYIPPASFVGRLVSVDKAGLRYAGLPDAIAQVRGPDAMAGGGWLLIDGQSPAASRWALGFVALFTGFAAFNLWGLCHLLRRVDRNPQA